MPVEKSLRKLIIDSNARGWTLIIFGHLNRFRVMNPLIVFINSVPPLSNTRKALK